MRTELPTTSMLVLQKACEEACFSVCFVQPVGSSKDTLFASVRTGSVGQASFFASGELGSNLNWAG
jgi:hypothetical protein